MLLSKLSEFDVDTLSVSNTKNATYLQSDKKKHLNYKLTG